MDLYVTRPPTKVSEMSDEELNAWATGVVETFRQAVGWSGGRGPGARRRAPGRAWSLPMPESVGGDPLDGEEQPNG